MRSITILIALVLLTLFALFAFSKVWSPYKLFYICLITLPLNYVFVALAGIPVHFLALSFVIMVILVSGNFGVCRDKALVSYWSCFVASLIISELYSKGFQFNWFTLYWILTVPVFWLVLSPPNETLALPLDKLLVGAGLVSSVASLFLLWLPQLKFLIPNLNRFYVNEYGYMRFGGTLGDYELFSELLVLAIICLFAPWRWTGKTARVSKLLPFIFMLTALIQTSTISGLLVIPGIMAVISVSNRKLSKSIITLASLFAVVYLIFVEFGATYAQRIANLSLDGSIAQFINRRNVWSKFDTLKPTEGWIGNGTRFPWNEFGVYPHSLYKSLLYMGGYLSLVLFAVFVLMLLKRQILNPGKFQRESLFLPIIIVIVFLIIEVKVEFIRIETYVVFVSAIFASARLTTQINLYNLHFPRTKHD